MAKGNAEPVSGAEPPQSVERKGLSEWFTRDGAWYVSSFLFHTLLMCFLMLLSTGTPPRIEGTAPEFDPTTDGPQEFADAENIQMFERGEVPYDPSELGADSLSILIPDIDMTIPNVLDAPGKADIDMHMPNVLDAPGKAHIDMHMPNLLDVPGGSMGDPNRDLGRKPLGPGPRIGVDINPGGSAGPGSAFNNRSTEQKDVGFGTTGGTPKTERAVGAALNWIARHQMTDGSWSLQRYQRQCKDRTCTYPGTHMSDSAATALALLPFLAAGQTHRSKGLYQRNIHYGIYWMMRQQNKDGDLSGKAKAMYAHGLATIMLCEAYGLTGDKFVGRSAQAAVDFIQKAQHPRTGGWRYTPGQEGDTSVVGWQVMALKSAQMAGLAVDAKTMKGAKNWLKWASAGKPRGQFSYTPESGPSPSMTSVGLLCSQYMGLRREDPVMVDGIKYLMGNMPNAQGRNIYYWYYATQVLHNLPGPDWDKWNRQMRRVLIDSQCIEGCATGSWDPAKPAKDALADTGGRLCLTSLSALTLEVYYRYLPLYKLDTEAALKASKPLSRGMAEKTSTQSVESATAKLPSEREKKAADTKKPEVKPAPRPEAKKS